MLTFWQDTGHPGGDIGSFIFYMLTAVGIVCIKCLGALVVRISVYAVAHDSPTSKETGPVAEGGV